MKVKCEYCGNFIQDTEEKCPDCGAPNSKMVRSGIGVPKTIQELLEFCNQHNLPLEKMRFFIGQDYKEPRAFGIYQDENGDFIVYKNKADGSRTVRYRGNDEAYAVNEIYQKLKSEIQMRKSEAASASKKKAPLGKAILKWVIRIAIGIGVVAAVIGLIYLLLFTDSSTPYNGYYQYSDSYYYYNNGSWYEYNDARENWSPLYNADSELTENYSEHWEGNKYNSDIDTTDFTQSEYYSVTEEDDWEDDWDDDDFDWDSGSDWNSDDTDWDSDW